MDNYLDTTIFPYYPSNVFETKPLGNVTLRQFITACKTPKPKMVTLFKKIEEARKAGDEKEKKRLKQKLYYFNPCVQTDGLGRTYDNITQFTGLAQIDFDGIQDAERFRDAFFKNVKSCVVAMVSPSKMGVKALVRIPKVKYPEDYKEYFCGLGYYLERYSGFDVAPYNPLLPLFICYDPDLKYREDATISQVRGQKVNRFIGSSDVTVVDGDIDPKIVEREIRNICVGIARLDGNAHPKLVGISTYAGGLVGNGFFSEDVIYNAMCEAIDNNDYMQKNLSGYKRTCLEMLRKGQLSPTVPKDWKK